MTQTVSTLAGNSSTPGSVDATGAAASFSFPNGLAVDGSGNVYVADRSNHKIRKITPAGVVTTFAGSGSQGSTDATGTAASFRSPTSVAVDAAGNVYVTDRDNNKIRKITPMGVVTTLAGSATNTSGNANGTGTAASFNWPTGIAVDASGNNIYVADMNNNKVRKITATGEVTTLAGTGAFGNVDGPNTVARLWGPRGVCIDGAGNLYVTENTHTIRKITPAGDVSTIAGNGATGSANGIGTAATFASPTGIVVDASGNIYVADYQNNQIRKITSTGVVTTFAGALAQGTTDGAGTAARFRNPFGLAIDASGYLYVGDEYYSLIRKITTPLSSEDFNSNNLKAKIYPNPVKDILNIHIENEIKSVEIYSLQGQRVLTSSNKNVNVSSLLKGIYLVRIEDENSDVATQKLIVE